MAKKYWTLNTGEIPEGITHDTELDVYYKDGVEITHSSGWDDACYWESETYYTKIIAWRFSDVE